MIHQMAIGEKLRKFKGDRTYSDIARAVGCTPENVRKILDQGTEPKLILGVRLARTLGADIDWLIDDEAEGDPPVDDRGRVVSIVEDALAGAGVTGEFSADEIRLVGVFRSLSEVEKVRLGGFLSGLTSREPLTPEVAARRIRAAADQVTRARQTDPNQSKESPEQSGKDSQTAS